MLCSTAGTLELILRRLALFGARSTRVHACACPRASAGFDSYIQAYRSLPYRVMAVQHRSTRPNHVMSCHALLGVWFYFYLHLYVDSTQSERLSVVAMSKACC